MSAPRTLRGVLSSRHAVRPLLAQSRATYHSYDHPTPPPYNEPEASILAAAIRHVPQHGFTSHALALGTKEARYLDISTNLFQRGAFDLVRYHLVTQRLALKDRVQFIDESMGVGRRVRSLVLARLRGNVEAGVVDRWQEALGLMSLAENIPASIRELSLLVDEIWFLAGDTAVDGSWYTKRGTLAGVYAATEMYQTTDQSTDFRDTEQFLDRRLEEVRTVGTTIGGATEWLAFQGGAMVNLLRSKGIRI